ncbi:MAG TPA: 3-deoxy-7-phosphoheptulonate synthase [Firmicutes bacterium]|nr:3-deoxy-7-phosphoheptulonate synthase [Bacillota bacterium]
MIVVMKSGATEEQIKEVENKLHELGFRTQVIHGTDKRVIGAIGDKRHLNLRFIELLPGVERAIPILRPFKLASREARPENTIVNIDGVTIGGPEITVIAGPCAVESREQLLETARAIKSMGCKILRGGAFKPRTSPYSFQGLEEEGLRLLAEAKEDTGLKIVTEVLDAQDVELVSSYTDIMQVGARNMQNFKLLKALGRLGKPVVLKRGLSATVEEWLMAAEYIMVEGNPNVILCERGIRTFEPYTRNTLDLSAVALVKQLSHLPVIVDPSHGTGRRDLVSPMAKAAVVAGADGLLIEAHIRPDEALSDGAQSLDMEGLARVLSELEDVARVAGRTFTGTGALNRRVPSS